MLHNAWVNVLPLVRLVLAASFAMTAGAADLVNLSAASFRGPDAAPASLAVAFGSNLSPATVAAQVTPPPPSLGGVTLKIRDSAGAERPAGLLFVSPTQINYLLPEGLALGPAVVTVDNGQGAVSTGPINILATAPGLFSANADGKGIAAATSLRVTPAGGQTSGLLARYAETLRHMVSVPIEMGGPEDRVFLTLYGTGIRQAASVVAAIQGQSVPVSYFGAHSQFPGLDQVNIEVPRNLAGHGLVTVQLTVDGQAANPVMARLARNQYLNLDFENVVSSGIWNWYSSPNGYEVASDASTKRSGSRSLRIRNVSAPAGQTASVSFWFPVVPARGKRIRFTGFLKTEAVSNGTSGITCKVDDVYVGSSTRNAVGPSGTSDWTPVSVEIDANLIAYQAACSVTFSGSGTVWADNFSIELDGVPYVQGPPPAIAEPDSSQLQWMRSNAIPFVTPDAGNGFDDLRPLKQLVGDARIVGLGESTHGTSEFFRMKHRMLEYLVNDLGFTIFAIEASTPECARINDYVLRGAGDPGTLLRSLYSVWRTQELIDLVQWMRQYNATGKDRIQFVGFDMQNTRLAVENVRAFVQRVEPTYMLTLNSNYADAVTVETATLPAARLTAAINNTRTAREYLEQNRSRYLAALTAAEVDWALQNARIVEQAVRVRRDGGPFREEAMAANIDWILGQNPGAKVVLWAHNYHVARVSANMGSHLADRYGAAYLPVGQLFHEGSYNTSNGSRFSAYEAIPSFPGTIEYLFHATGTPRSILNLRAASPSDPASSWLLDQWLYRSIGSLLVNGFGEFADPAADFDAIIFFDRGTPSKLLF